MPSTLPSRRRVSLATGAVTALTALLVPLSGPSPAVAPAVSPVVSAAGGPGARALAYVANDDGGTVEIRDFLGATTATRSSEYNQGDDVASGDVDGDGVDEIVVGNDTGTNDFSGSVDVIRADGTTTRFGVLDFDGGDDEVAVGQLIEGGPAEIAVASTDQGTVSVFDGAGTRLARVPTAFGHVDAFDVADVTGDGVDELLVANADGDSDGRVDVLDLEGEQAHPPVDTSYDDDDGDDAFAAGDVTGDGRADLVVANTEGDGRVDVHDLHGDEPDTAFDVPSAYDNGNEAGAESTDALAVGDVTGDDVEDVVVANTEGGRVDVLDLAGDDDGDFPSAYDDDDSFTVGQARPSDLDRDGIPDQQEIDGVVSQFGTSPCRKDVIVESDVMADTSGDADDHSHRPFQSAMDQVVDAFAALDVPGVTDCPYPGEDASDGIRLEITEPTVSMESLPHDDVLTLPTEFDDLKTRHFDAAAADAYVHYAIWGHQFDAGGGATSGGRADAGVDDQDFVLALDDPNAQGNLAIQAATFMHELGHVIGLRHGGDENLNCKPQYFSVMNYAYPLGPVDSSGASNRLFSSSDLPDLEETSLDEGDGVSDPESQRVSFTNGLGQLRERLTGGGAQDWSGDNADGQGGTADDSGVDADLGAKVRTASGVIACNAGDDVGLQTLHGYDDRTALAEDLDAIDFDGAEALVPELTAQDLVLHQDVEEAQVFPETTTPLDSPRPGFRAASLGLAVDEDFVYATHNYRTIAQPATSDRAGSLLVLDRDTMEVVDRIRVGFGPSAVALDPGRDRAYVVNRGQQDYSVSVVDTATRTVVDEIDLQQGPVDVAVNPNLNRIYVANPFQETIQVIDGATGDLLEPIDVGPGLSSLAFDQNTGSIWYTAFVRGVPDAFAAVGTVVDDGVTRPRVLPPIDLGSADVQPVDVAIDPLLARVYIGGLGVNQATEPPSVTVIHRNTRVQLARIPTTGPVRAVAVDADAGLVFAAGDRGVDVLGTGVTELLDHIDAALPFSVAVGPGATRQLYVGDFVTGELRRRNYGGTP
jgi:YVTN family beta-propeller protein